MNGRRHVAIGGPDRPSHLIAGLALIVALVAGPLGNPRTTVAQTAAQTSVVGVVNACPTASSALVDCEEVAGATVTVLVDGVAAAGSPFTTALNSIGFPSFDLTVQPTSTLTITVTGGLPAGYALLAGSNPFVATAASLPIGGCGGESTCSYANLVAVPAVAGAGEVDLTISNAACPPGYDGDDFFAACYGNPAVGNAFRVGPPNTDAFSGNVATDGSGFVSFIVRANGQIRIIQEEPTNGAGFAVACTSGGASVPVTQLSDEETGSATIAVADLTLSGDAAVRCDWYTLLTATTAPDPDDDDGDGAGPVTGLPNTGAGTSSVSSDGLVGGPGMVAVLVLALVVGLGVRRRLVARSSSIGALRQLDRHIV
ncbi:MAG: hypothetical protein H0U40_00760 [Chloroflexia bacterium]|nr:hypothetical protein [Chloroflexia bacterium]